MSILSLGSIKPRSLGCRGIDYEREEKSSFEIIKFGYTENNCVT
jgi:hypothetical protein